MDTSISGASFAASRDFCMVYQGKVLDAKDDSVQLRATTTLADVVGCYNMHARTTTMTANQNMSNHTIRQINLQVWTRQRGGCFMVRYVFTSMLSVCSFIFVEIDNSLCHLV